MFFANHNRLGPIVGNGFIILHRKLLEHPLFKKAGLVRLWVFILGITQYKDGPVLYRGQTVELKRGQFVIGERWAAVETGLNRGQVRGLLAVMETEKMIQRITRRATHRLTHRFSVFSVENWDKYQFSQPTEQPTEQPTDNPLTNPLTNPLNPDEKQQNPTRRATHRLTHTQQEDINKKSIAATGVPATYIGIARSFLEKQRAAFPKESAWKDFEGRVGDGAKNLHLFHTQNDWTEEEIGYLLDWVAKDDFWSGQIRSLGGIRSRKKGGDSPMKFENAMAAMRSKNGGPAPGGELTYDEVLQIMLDENIPMEGYFERQESGTWLRL